MPYYLIEKHPVFLTHKKYNELRDEVSKDKSPIWRTSSMIQGHEEAQEKNILFISHHTITLNVDFKSLKYGWEDITLKYEELLM